AEHADTALPGTNALTLAALLDRAGQPRPAAERLQQALSAGLVEATAVNWRRLGDLWMRAQEPLLALDAIEQALALAEASRVSNDRALTAELLTRRAELAAMLDDWPRVIAAASAALIAEPGAQSPGKLHLLQGLAHHRLGRRDAARRAFTEAAGYSGERPQALAWLELLAAP
ncbi:MAG: hypothetical protein WBG92_05205, partial [Thiohalocapsa sp.]